MRFLCALLIMCVSPAWAASERVKTEAELKKVEQAQHEKEAQSKELAATSAKLQTEVGKIKTKLVEVSRRLAEHEERRDQLQVELFNTQQQHAKLAEEHQKSQSGLRQVLGVLLRLTQLPPGAMVFSSRPPSETIDTNIGIRAILSDLNHRVVMEKEQLAALTASEQKLRAAQAAVAEAEAKIAADRIELSQLLKQREATRQQTEADRVATEEAAKALAARASDLRELINQLRAREAAMRARHPRAKPPKVSKSMLAAVDRLACPSPARFCIATASRTAQATMRAALPSPLRPMRWSAPRGKAWSSLPVRFEVTEK